MLYIIYYYTPFMVTLIIFFSFFSFESFLFLEVLALQRFIRLHPHLHLLKTKVTLKL